MWYEISRCITYEHDKIINSDVDVLEKENAQEVYQIFLNRVDYDESCYVLVKWWESDEVEVIRLKSLLKNFTSDIGKKFAERIEFWITQGTNFFMED